MIILEITEFWENGAISFLENGAILFWEIGAVLKMFKPAKFEPYGRPTIWACHHCYKYMTNVIYNYKEIGVILS